MVITNLGAHMGWMRRCDSNTRPSTYEADKLPTAPLRNIKNGDPQQIRTAVLAVKGLSLDHLTNGPKKERTDFHGAKAYGKRLNFTMKPIGGQGGT